MTQAYYQANLPNLRRLWQCPQCSEKINTKKRGDNTPVRRVHNLPGASAAGANMDMSCDELSAPEEPTPPKSATDTETLRSSFEAFQESVLRKLDVWFSKHDLKITKMLEEFEEVKSAMSFMSGQYDDLHKKTDEMCKKVSVMEHKLEQVEQQNSRISQLERKLDDMEQQARQNNVEISNLPEKRGENLLSIVKTLGDNINHPLAPQDVVSVHRVPQANPTSTQPKNVIVKLATRELKDNFVSAARKVKGKLTSESLNIPGLQQKVYVNEHLTLKNKSIFRKARETAKTNGYRFVWVKHGTVLVRAAETTPVLAVRCEEDLTKLKPRIA
ncbi:uncharacterized protein LOC125488798 [Plutella xylostella]|uniref:uncharacterized protein LOC125488798 n=1 Tax=Plutella xylostella TaxID=51655 RepID=UPI00203275E7|nr:uncharacterized protein LOC125488798 [Plutella xylostella]